MPFHQPQHKHHNPPTLRTSRAPPKIKESPHQPCKIAASPTDPTSELCRFSASQKNITTSSASQPTASLFSIGTRQRLRQHLSPVLNQKCYEHQPSPLYQQDLSVSMYRRKSTTIIHPHHPSAYQGRANQGRTAHREHQQCQTRTTKRKRS
jgi:hypothetical protein